MPTRRTFLESGLALGGSALIGTTATASIFEQVKAAPPQVPTAAQHAADPNKFWLDVRKQFLFPPGMTYLNNGTIGSSPAPVLKAVFDAYNTIEQLSPDDPEDYPLWGYGVRPFYAFRDAVAAFVGATRDEIAVTRSSTEGINFAANGIDMKAGDEVIITDQEHHHGFEPWRLKAKRYGIVVKTVALEKPVRSGDDVLARFSDAITPRTRVIFFSHSTTDTGVVLPAKDLCAIARSRGILSVVDGAQTIGMMRINVRDIGCDIYCGTGHKWLQGPKGTGFLYIRDEVIDRIWNTLAGEGWDNPALRIQRFQGFGTSNVPCLHGLKAAIDFANKIGLDRIEQRHRELADYVLKEMTKRGAESWTSPDPKLRCAMTTVNLRGIDRLPFEQWMWKTHRIRIRGGEPSRIRLCMAYYLQKSEIDRFLAAFDEYRKRARTMG